MLDFKVIAEQEFDGDVDDAEQLRKVFRDIVQQRDAVELGKLRGPVFSSANDCCVFYAGCKTHEKCDFRYRCEFQPKNMSMRIFGKNEHSALPAMCRKDAEVPLTKQQRSAILSETHRRGADCVQPFDVHQSLEDDPPPGRAVQNLVQRARVLLRIQRGEHSVTVDGLEDWCVARAMDIYSPPHVWPGESSDLTVLFAGSGATRRFPILSGDMFLPLAARRFVEHIFDVAGEGSARGLVGQSDFMFKIVWQGYALGIVGVQLFRRLGRRWTKYFCPVVCLLTRVENTTANAVLFEIALSLLREEANRRNVALPSAVFAQLHADFADSSRRAVRGVLLGTRLVNDLEHLFRNLRKNQSGPSRLHARPIHVVVAYIGFTAHLPTGLLFHCFWKIMLAHMASSWKANAFVAYLKQEYIRTSKQGFFYATWWTGLYSTVRSGHPSQPELGRVLHQSVASGAQLGRGANESTDCESTCVMWFVRG